MTAIDGALIKNLDKKNSDDNFDVTWPKQKKSRNSGTDTIAYLREKTEKDFELRAEELKAQKRAVRYGKAKTRNFSKPHGNTYTRQQMNAILLIVGKLSEKP